MKRLYAFILIMMMFIASVQAIQTPVNPSFIASDEALSANEELIADARLVWNAKQIGMVSLEFRNQYSQTDSFTLAGDNTGTNSNIYLYYSILGDISAKLSIKASGPLRTGEGAGHIDWGIYNNSDRNTCISGMGTYEFGDLSSAYFKGSGSIQFYVTTVNVDVDENVQLVVGDNEYSSNMEVKIEII